MPETRQIVVPGERVGNPSEHRPGMNTYEERDGIYALRLGVKSVRGDRVDVISLNGRYEPGRGDMVIGTVAEVGPSNWYINIGAANDVGMHVNDTPWRVDFGETSKYLAVGDTVLLKIVHVDELKKAQVSMKDRACRKLTGGLILEVAPSKVPRIVGRQGSMIGMIKDATNVRLFVGQNGVIWIDGEPEDVSLALEALRKIEDEAHTSGLTDRMKAWLEERRPSANRVHKQSTDEAPPEEEARPVRRGRSETEKHRLERPAEETLSDEEAAEEISRRPTREGGEGQHVRHHSDRRAGVRGEGPAAREGPRGQVSPQRDGEREHRHGGEREQRHAGERERRGGRDERPGRDERRGGGDERRGREERPARRFEEREERPARRVEDEERPRRDERPARRVADEDERPARREERPARRFEEREERPARRFEESRPTRRFDDEERPRREERPARRFDDEAPARREERPAPRRITDDEDEAPRPARRFADDDEERGSGRGSGRDEPRGRRRGGRGRDGSGREGGSGRRMED